MTTENTAASPRSDISGDSFTLNWPTVWPLLFTPSPEKYLAYKKQAEHFVVTEQLGFELSGEGEHLFLWIEKTNLNTEQISGFLSRQFDLHKRDIAYSGLKDKFATTYQWFSIPWPIKKPLPELESIAGFGWKTLTLQRHERKLKRGVHKTNAFTIELHAQGLEASDWAAIGERLDLMAIEGFANYFGEQRFGHQGGNLLKAQKLFNKEIKLKKPLRSIIFSAARSYLFNQYLAQRIKQQQWQTLLTGDVLQIDGSQSYFIDDINDDVQQRFAKCQLHAMAPLIGQNNRDYEAFLNGSAAKFLQLEAFERNWPEKLADAGLKSLFRALRVMPRALQFEQVDSSKMLLRFELPSGCYATALLREISALNFSHINNSNINTSNSSISNIDPGNIGLSNAKE